MVFFTKWGASGAQGSKDQAHCPAHADIQQMFNTWGSGTRLAIIILEFPVFSEMHTSQGCQKGDSQTHNLLESEEI